MAFYAESCCPKVAYRTIAPAVATLSDSTPAAIGIRKPPVSAGRMVGLKPWPSFESTNALFAVNFVSNNELVLTAPMSRGNVAQRAPLNAASAAGKSTSSSTCV